MRVIIISAIIVFLVLPWSDRAEGASSATAGVFDHYQPAGLNQAALRAIDNGDKPTALVLLERAARLAPQDQCIQHNLAELRADMEGEPFHPQGEKSLSRKQISPVHENVQILPAPPPLWEKTGR